MHHEEGHFAGVGGLQLFWQCWLPDAALRRAPHRTPTGAAADDAAPDPTPAPKAGPPPKPWSPSCTASASTAAVTGTWSARSSPAATRSTPTTSAGTAARRGRACTSSAGPTTATTSRAFLGLVAAREPGRPLVLYGHSMGSLVVLDYLLECRRPRAGRRLAGAIVSGVALQPAGVGKPYQVVMARALSRVAPRLSVDLRHRRRLADARPAKLSRRRGRPAAHVAGDGALGRREPRDRAPRQRRAWRPSSCRCSCCTAAPTR